MPRKTYVLRLTFVSDTHYEIRIYFRNKKEYTAESDNEKLYNAFHMDCISKEDYTEQKRAETLLIDIVKKENYLR